MKTYEVTDGNGKIEIEAEDTQDACQQFVSDGDWGNNEKTFWVTCRATEVCDPRYDATGLAGYDYLRDLQQGQADARFPQNIDLSDLSAEEKDAVAAYMRLNDGTVSDEDQEFGEDIADELDDLGAIEPESESHTITVEPTVPSCTDGQGDAHVWAQPQSVVGGCKENPGVRGNGGGVIITECCRCCGNYQITDTWAQNPENGEQGLTSTEYRDSDTASEAWLTRRQEHYEQWVRDNSDDEIHDEDDLEQAFIAIFHRESDDSDKKNGLWSLLCQAVGAEKDEVEA